MNTPLTVCETSVVQIPNQDNGFHAICATQVVTPTGQTFTTIGESFGESDNPDKSLLQRAEQRAYERAIELMQSHTGPTTAPHSSAFPERDAVSAKIKRSTEGAITEKQKRFIATTAFHNGKTFDDAEVISQELYGRSIDRLKTTEVNPILDRLKV